MSDATGLADTLTIQQKMALYKEMTDSYADSHPFLHIKLAELCHSLHAGSLAIASYRKVSIILLHLQVVILADYHLAPNHHVYRDSQYALVEKYVHENDEQVNSMLNKSHESNTLFLSCICGDR